MNSVKEINVKNDIDNCFDEIINIKNLNPSKLQMDEKIFSYTRSVILKTENDRCKIIKILIFCSLC